MVKARPCVPMTVQWIAKSDFGLDAWMILWSKNSTTRNIYALEFDSASGSMSNKRVFFSTADMGERTRC